MKYSSDPSPRLSPLTDLHADLVVRPDHLQVRFQLCVEVDLPDQGPALLKEACEQLQRRACDATGTDVRVRPRDVQFGPATSRKLKLPEDEDRSGVTVDGVLEMPLGASLDFWARSTQVASLMRVCQELMRDAREEKARPRARFGPPVPRVAQPEEHRAELLRRLAARLREFQSTLAPTEVPLRPTECVPPGPVEQSPVSLEEVALSLRVVWPPSGTRDAVNRTHLG
jgi:hypothetical protein